MIQTVVQVANIDFEYRTQTTVISRDVNSFMTNKFLKEFKGSVIIEAKDKSPKQVVLLLNSYVSFVKLYGMLKPDLTGKTILHSGAKFLIVLFSKPNRLTRIFSHLWNYYAVDVVVIVYNKMDKIALYTYFPYKNPLSCESVRPSLIGLWGETDIDPNDFYPDKMSNMNGCPLFISTTKVYHPATERRIPLQMIKKSMHHILGDIMNFRPVISNKQYISIDSDGAVNWTKSLNDVITGAANISTSTVALGFEKANLLDFSAPYFRIRLAWIAPPTTTGTTLWKLLAPLNGYLWLGLLVVTLFVNFVPYGMRFKPIRNFSYHYFNGFKKLNGVTFRTWGVLMGQPIRVTPRKYRDFYIIGIWLWFTFFVRSAYQSVLIGALKTDTIVGNFANLQEAVDEGFTFGGRSGILGYFEHDPLFREGFKVITDSDYEQIFRDVLDCKKNFVIATSLEYAWTLCVAEAISEEHCGYVLPDSILMVPLVVWMQKSSPFMRPLSVWLPRLLESGLLIKDAEQKPLKDIKASDTSPLTQRQASSCFIFLILGYILSVIVFVVEILIVRWR
ncbi:uncharacterized protein LOC125054844 [Pieris napi]|uniref:uncharacterized protein LOC125054844 n=1 Tax=Pieris napi TaxID=78633 RepID=UPI001FBBF9C0|nr:uncharacterized protein LOC125054844 [Pieris napi]